LRQVVLVLIGLLIVGGGIAWADYDFDNWVTKYDSVVLAPHTIEFYGRSYDSGSDQSTWYYSVISGNQPEVSHWVLELCYPDHVVSDASGTQCGFGVTSNCWALGTDPHVNIYGIKWDVGLTAGVPTHFWVTLEGNWTVEDVEVGIKAGGDIYNGYILGPSCTPIVPPQLEVAVSGLKNLTIDQPSIGQWAATGDLKALIGDPNDGTGLTVTVTATVSYYIYVSYSYSMSPAGFLPSPEEPLSFEYPTSSGTWYTIPKYGTWAPLHGLSGTATHSYPVAVDLTKLGDRTANDSITFTIHVMVTQ
jgi:hypothetical protein